MNIKNLFIMTGLVIILGACANEQLEKVEVNETVNFSEVNQIHYKQSLTSLI